MDLLEDLAVGAVGGLALRGLQKLIFQRGQENVATEVSRLSGLAFTHLDHDHR